MNKAQKIIAVFFIIITLIIAVLVVIYMNQPKNYYICKDNSGLPSGIVLYYGDTCPHCKIVEQFLRDNNVTAKINITQKEVFLNQTNGQELISIGSNCKIPAEYMGAVPLLYSEGKAYLGDKDIISFLENKLNIIPS